MRIPDIAADPWVGVESVHGFALDEVRSALQKAIRRGQLDNAVLLATEMFLSGPAVEDLLWQRLEVISVEDIGFGRANAAVLIEALGRFRLRAAEGSDDRLVFATHAVRFLSLSMKDRTTYEMATWARQALEHGEALPEIPDVAVDMHTKRGQEMGRGYAHWFEDGAEVANEIPNRDLTYRNRIHQLLWREGHIQREAE